MFIALYINLNWTKIIDYKNEGSEIINRQTKYYCQFSVYDITLVTYKWVTTAIYIQKEYLTIFLRGWWPQKTEASQIYVNIRYFWFNTLQNLSRICQVSNAATPDSDQLNCYFNTELIFRDNSLFQLYRKRCSSPSRQYFFTACPADRLDTTMKKCSANKILNSWNAPANQIVSVPQKISKFFVGNNYYRVIQLTIVEAPYVLQKLRVSLNTLGNLICFDQMFIPTSAVLTVLNPLKETLLMTVCLFPTWIPC